MLSLFECITCSSSFSEEKKIIVIVNWIFHVSDFLRSFMTSFKYGLILSRYYSIFVTITFEFNIIIIYSKNYLLLLVYNNLLSFSYSKKMLNISKYSISLIPLTSFFSLKRFLISLFFLLQTLGIPSLYIIKKT